MKVITAEDKDRVLKWFYEADVNGNEMPQDVLPERSQEICAILLNDGYTTKGEFRGMLTLKGQSFYLNGGYVKERDEKERTLKLAEEANKIAKQAKRQSFFSNVIAFIAILLTAYLGIVNNDSSSKSNSSNPYERKFVSSDISNKDSDSIIIYTDTTSSPKGKIISIMPFDNNIEKNDKQ